MKPRFLYILFAVATTLSYSADFKIPLRAVDSHGMIDTVWFGVNQNATLCIDATLGELELPPLPPSFQIRFVNYRSGLGTCLGLGVKTDLRPYLSPDQGDTYRILISIGDGSFPFTLSWPDLNSFFTTPVHLLDVFGGSVVNIDMKAQTSFTVTEDLGLQSFLIKVGDGTVVLASPTIIAFGALSNTVTQTSAELSGQVIPNGDSTTTWFEWGTTDGYGNESEHTSVGNGITGSSINSVLSNLTPRTTYHFRVVAQNAIGTTQSSDHTFTTMLDGTIGQNLLPLSVSDANSITRTLWIGADSQATSCVDPSLGEVALPPVPPGLDVRSVGFPGHTCLGLGVNMDFRKLDGSTQVDTYRVSVSAEWDHFPITFSWPDLSQWFNGPVKMIDVHGGLGVNIDMQQRTSFILPDSLGISSFYLITGVPALATPAPAVLTLRASEVHQSSAEYNAELNPNGYASTGWFEWGTTAEYGQSTAQRLNDGTTNVIPIAEIVTELAPATTYHYRYVAQNLNGTTYGPDQSFKTMDVTAVDDPKTKAAKFQLRANYPNPFNPTTTFSFAISRSSFVSLKVYDPLGREVAVVVNEELPPGEYSRVWRAMDLPSGVYLCRLTAERFSEARKVLLLR